MKKGKEDQIVWGSIVLFFILYMIGYAWLIGPKKETERRTEEKMMLPQKEIAQTRTEKRQPKSLSADWPSDLGKYFYTIDIAPDYEMEDEEYEVVGESGGNYRAARLVNRER